VISPSLKNGWRMVKFGDVVRQCKEKVNRENNPFERYVEGGHMDSEDIHIRRWGEFGEDYVGPAFHRIFRKGQVLYGSRRTYLKKVAVADFDGITANTTFVLETQDQGAFMQELLPFLMLTNRFTEHSIAESKGSTNPYINYPDIAKFEFPLPPIEEQKRIAEILWAADETVEKFGEVAARLGTLRQIESNRLFADTNNLVTIQELVEQGVLYPPQDGNHGNDHPKAKDYVHEGIPFIMASNLSNHKVDVETCKFIPESVAASLRIGFSIEGDVLLSHKGTVGEVAIVQALETPYIMLTPQVTYYRVKNAEVLNPRYLFYCFLSTTFQRALKRLSAQSTRAYVGITAQRKFAMPLPDIETQNRHLEVLDHMHIDHENLKRHQRTIRTASSIFANSLHQDATRV